MKRRKVCSCTIYLLSTALVMTAAGSGSTLARQRKAQAPAESQTLFSCHVDTRYALRPVTDADSDQTFAMSGRRSVDEEVKLTVDVRSHQLTLFIHTEGGLTQMHLLREVEQGSSGGSGAGGRADTVIRGKDGADIFTLFSGYDNNGADHDAALQVGGPDNFLLNCDSDPYNSPQVKGLGRFGSTNIYGLHADGLAAEMKDFPREPDLQRQP
jgi:hypothetical protein